MVKMHTIALIIALISIICISNALNNEVNTNNGRYNPQYNDPYYNNRNYYNNRYHNNRDYYNNRQYYERHFRNYNPDVVAPQARIVEQEMKTPDEGAYSFSYDTDNGIHADEHGVSVQMGKDEQKEVVEGSYSFVTPEGVQVLVRYTADENGFHPTITYGGAEGSQYARRAPAAGVVITNSN